MSTAIVQYESYIRVFEVVNDVATVAANVESGKAVAIDDLRLYGSLIDFEGETIADVAPDRPQTLEEAFELAHECEGLLSVRLNGVCVWSWEAVMARRAAIARAAEKAEREAAKAAEKKAKEEAKAAAKAEREAAKAAKAAMKDVPTDWAELMSAQGRAK